MAATSSRIVPTILPSDSPAISSVLPIRLDDFFASHFNRAALRLNHTRTHLDVAKHLWSRDDLASNLQDMAADKNGSGLLKNAKLYGGSFKMPDSLPLADEVPTFVDRALEAGTSLTLQFEYVSAPHRPLRWLSEGLFNLTGIPASVHLYCSAPGAKVLQPHTDPYDVLVWQLRGTKQWRACVPRSEIAAASYSAGSGLTDAQRCLLQELARDNIKGCTQYSVDDTHSLLCDDFTMAPGDMLYMPKGVVHYAVTDNATEAFHLTIGLHRENMQWLDVFYHMLVHAEGIAAAEAEEQQRVALELMQIYSETAEGVHLHEVVPGWLLLCRRTWMRERVAAGKAAGDDELAGCAANDAELTRLYELHLNRLGDWSFKQSQAGPWKLAVTLAEREKPAGEVADLAGFEHLFWWTGELGFMQRLRADRHADAVRLARAFDWIAEVVDFQDTKTDRWKRRKRGGSTQQTVRRRGEKKHEGEGAQQPASFCDELSGWESECRGSDADHCEANVVSAGEPTSCESWCGSHGAWCEAAWEDKAGGCEKQKDRSGRPYMHSCQKAQRSQICRCRRECADEGPWKCHEEGCPAREVSCSILSVACRARFSDIWRKPPASLGQMTVRQACPFSCNVCISARAEYNASLAASTLPPFVSAKPSALIHEVLASDG